MTPREIVIRTIEFRDPPRIPLAFWNFEIGDADLSHTPVLADAVQGAFDDIHCVSYAAADGGPITRNIEGRGRVDEWGVTWIEGRAANPPIETWDEWKSYPFPDAHAPSRFAGVDASINANRQLYLLGLIWNTTFERMWMLRGFENLLVDPYENRRMFFELRDRYLEFSLAILDRWLETEVDSIYYGDDLGTQIGLVMSPEMWRQLYLPMYRELFGRARAAGKHVFFHSCGDVTPIIPDMLDCGLNVLNPVQPQAMDVRAILREFGKDLVVWGATDLQNLLSRGTPGDIEKEIEDVVSLCWRSGGYIGGTAQGSAPGTPLANIETFCRTFTRLSRAGQPAES
ncbi:MAG: uroporphyrinogen decarboxylase family protein [Lentisphaeria bacterium]|jgi:uroporphyrinogen decarboxylase|nr:uroporphyrinogen decarboxylase family protein [Lentisphaeria bacterium]MDP7741701.1 uroporphyrinogen decarboxylase family protein [Lentisphaeria bacterium]